MKGDVIQMNKKAQSNHVASKQKNFVLLLQNFAKGMPTN